MQLTPVALDVVVRGMKQYPANMADFMDMFPTEDACLEYLSMVRWPEGYKCLRCGKGDYLEEGPWPFHLPRMRVRGVCAGRHSVSRHAQTAPLVVSGDVVCGEPEKRRQRAGDAKGAGPGQLPHRMGMVAQAAPRHGSSRPRQAIRHKSKPARLSLAASAGVAGVAPKASPWFSLRRKKRKIARMQLGAFAFP